MKQMCSLAAYVMVTIVLVQNVSVQNKIFVWCCQ
jgi:hypothetical protein